MHRLLDLLMVLLRRRGHSDFYHGRPPAMVREGLIRALSFKNLLFLVAAILLLLVIIVEFFYVVLLLIGPLFSFAIKFFQGLPPFLDAAAITQYAIDSLQNLVNVVWNSFPLKWTGLLWWLIGTFIYAGSIFVWGIGVFRNAVSQVSKSSGSWYLISWLLLIAGIAVHLALFFS